MIISGTFARDVSFCGKQERRDVVTGRSSNDEIAFVIDHRLHDGVHDAFGIFDRCSSIECRDIRPRVGDLEERVCPWAFDAGEETDSRSHADGAGLLAQTAKAVAEQCRCRAFDGVAVSTE